MICNNVSVYFASNVGNSRQNQEDNAILPGGAYLTPELVKEIGEKRQTHERYFAYNFENGFLAAVSDGMGGHASGEVASAQVVQYLCANYQRIVGNASFGERFLVDEIAALNRLILSCAKGDAALRGMGATLCGVVASNGCYYGVNVGDSRLYRYYNGKLEQLSTDHTEGERLLKLNLLTKEEYQRFPRRKNLYKYMGVSSELVADVFKIGSCVPGATLLLCSDGLADVVSHDEIETVLATGDTPEQKGRTLLQRALEANAGHGDNITLILINF